MRYALASCAPNGLPVASGSRAWRYGHRASWGAFTLVEVLVSMTVLLVLMVMVTQMVSSASKVTGLSQRHIDADSEARAVFERMARDFGGMVRRPDVDCSIYPYGHSFKFPAKVSDPPANDALYFFTQSNSILADDNRGKVIQDAVGVAGYRVWENPNYFAANTIPIDSNSRSPFFGLDRLGVSTTLYMPFDRGMQFLASDLDTSVTPNVPKGSYRTTPANVDKGTTLIFGTYPTAAQNPDVNYHCIGESIFRLEFGLQMKDGTYYLEPPNSPTQTIQDMRNVTAIVVTMALLDHRSRKIIPGYDPLAPMIPYATDMQNLEYALNDGNTPAVASDWNNALAKLPTSMESPSRNISSITRRVAAQNVHVYQRIFYLR